MYRPIRDYAIIGNLRSAALVSKGGSVDWAPAPFIDSPSVFAALLDEKKGGFWSIAPSEAHTSTQSYLKDTNVLATKFSSEKGVLELIDFIPIEEEKTSLPAEEDTTFRLHRRVRCTQGLCPIEIIFEPKFDYARGETALSETDGGIFVENAEKRGVLAARCPFTIEGGRASARVTLKKGESLFFIFRYNTGTVELRKNGKAHHDKELDETVSFWREWSRECDLPVCPVIEGPYRDAVIRSALVLKILFFEPVGTVAAAATTSLPEAIGGMRNWDYRFTWLRDASFVFQAFFRLGHLREAGEYIRWLIGVCTSSAESAGPEHLQIMYGLRGERVLPEEVLTNLDGYRGSRPVRIGNSAYGQKQWDIYGSVFDMIWRLHRLEGGTPLSAHTWRVLRDIADYVMHIWKEPDEGLWEVRGGKQHFVYSKAMCSVALDRAARLAEAYGLDGDTALWREESRVIKDEVLSRGFDDSLGAFVQRFDSSDLDASVLLLPAVEFIKGDDPRMLSTIAAIKRELLRDDGLVLRYTADDGLPGREGAFLLASFWLVDALVLAGKEEEGRALFEKVIAKANHAGLFSEEMDPSTGEFLGNFPQAYTHVGLINSAFRLSKIARR